MTVLAPPGTGKSAGGFALYLPRFNLPGSLTDGRQLTTADFANGSPSAAKFADYIKTLKQSDPAYYNAFLNYYGINPADNTTKLRTALTGALKTIYDLGTVPSVGGHLGHITAQEVAYINSGGVLGTAPPTVSSSGVLQQDLTANRIGSAYDTIQGDFYQWGLSNLVPWAKDQIFNHGATAATILNELRYGKSPQHQEYENAFPGLAQHNSTNGVGSEHLTEAQYQQIVQSYQDLGNRYGLPQGFLSKQEIGNLIRGNVSPTTFQQRLTDGYVAAQNATPEAKALLQQYYGIGPKEMTAYWLNPQKALPLLQRQIAAATIGGYAQQTGLSGLSQADAEELASRARLGATAGNQGLAASTTGIENSLLAASKNVGLEGSGAPGANLPGVDLHQLIGSQIAGFGGTTQVGAQQALDKAASARAGIDTEGGGYDQTAKGVTGVGGATS
jgi:hypothetical protein